MRLSIGEVKSCAISDDRKEVHLTLSTKYIGERDYSIPVDKLDGWIAALNSAKSLLNGSDKLDPNQVRFDMPKNCTVAADLHTHHLVLLILDHKLQTQKGYALTPEAAKMMAAGLAKNAEAVLARRETQ